MNQKNLNIKYVGNQFHIDRHKYIGSNEINHTKQFSIVYVIYIHTNNFILHLYIIMQMDGLHTY